MMGRLNVLKLILITVIVAIFLMLVISCSKATEKRDVSDFDQVNLYGSGDLIIEQGDSESLTIEAQANIMRYIETTVSGGALSISIPDKEGRPNRIGSVKYYLMVKDLDGVKTFGSGNINFADFETDSIKIIIGGSGTITLSGKAESQEIEINGSGKYSAKDFESSECIVKINGSGNASVNVTDNLDITINGSGDVKYTGDPSVQRKQN